MLGMATTTSYHAMPSWRSSAACTKRIRATRTSHHTQCAMTYARYRAGATRPALPHKITCCHDVWRVSRMGGKDPEPHYVHDVMTSWIRSVTPLLQRWQFCLTWPCLYVIPWTKPSSMTHQQLKLAHLPCNLPLIRRTRLVRHCPMYKIRISWWHVRMAIRCQTSTIFCVGKGD